MLRRHEAGAMQNDAGGSSLEIHCVSILRPERSLSETHGTFKNAATLRLEHNRVCGKTGAKGVVVLPLFPIFRHFFHFHKNPSSSVISGTFSCENRFPPKPKKRPKIAKHTKHETLPKRDAISLKFP
jgi:hypothetical protein